MKAKFGGVCHHCSQRYSAGTEILNRAGKWGHALCPTVKADASPVAQAPAQTFTPSPYQQAIYDFVRTGSGNAVVEAVAGGGKTSTIVQALRFTSAEASVAFVAFNQHIAKELKTRAPEHVTVSTLHALGFANLRETFGRVRVDERKLDRIMDDVRQLREVEQASKDEQSATKLLRMNMAKLVALSKATLVNVRDSQAVRAMVARYGLDLNGGEDELIVLLPRVMEACQELTAAVDFDDMIWLPIVLGLKVKQYDWLFVDECQDLNASQIELVLRSIKPGGRAVAVGDRHQSLYGFRGADTEAVDRIIKALNAQTLPLSVSYRCPTSHITLAQSLVPHIQARANAPAGKVETIKDHQFALKVGVGDMVICRLNAPLVGPAFDLIRRGIKAVVRGRDIGANLAALVVKLGGDTLDELAENLNEYTRREMKRLQRREANESQVQALEDKVETLSHIIAECETPEQVIEKIRSLFSDDVEGVVFSSIHRAKGLEADRVFILRPDKLPLERPDMQAWEIEQEHNCQYVAYTRSKSELYFVEPPQD